VSYVLEVRPVTSEPSDHDVVFRANKADPIVVEWIGPKQLEICYTQAQIFHYTNFKALRLDDNFHTVSIELSKHTECSRDDLDLSRFQ